MIMHLKHHLQSNRCWSFQIDTLSFDLTHWGRVTHICVVKLTIIGSGNGLSPGRRQAIIWTNAGILLIGPLGTNFSEILIRVQTFSFKKMLLKMSSAKWRPFCFGLNVVSHCHSLEHQSPPGQRFIYSHDALAWNLTKVHFYLFHILATQSQCIPSPICVIRKKMWNLHFPNFVIMYDPENHITYESPIIRHRSCKLLELAQHLSINPPRPWPTGELCAFNTLRPRQNGRHFADDIFKRIFLSENVWISMKISLNFVLEVSINNIPALVQIMAPRRPSNKSLSESMMVSLLTHICVTRPQWVNSLTRRRFERHFRYIMFKLILVIDDWSISGKIALRWMSLNLTDDKSALVQVMAWCRQAPSH